MLLCKTELSFLRQFRLIVMLIKVGECCISPNIEVGAHTLTPMEREKRLYPRIRSQ